jgi:hypothetical protein
MNKNETRVFISDLNKGDVFRFDGHDTLNVVDAKVNQANLTRVSYHVRGDSGSSEYTRVRLTTVVKVA